jgi:hypothetical protein
MSLCSGCSNGKYNTPSSVACEHLDNCLPQTSQDLILKPVRVATSRSARQTYLNSLLFMIASSILFGLAIVAYIIFYIEYIPQIGIERVVHLQYGFVDSPRPGYAQGARWIEPDAKVYCAVMGHIHMA